MIVKQLISQLIRIFEDIFLPGIGIKYREPCIDLILIMITIIIITMLVQKIIKYLLLLLAVCLIHIQHIMRSADKRISEENKVRLSAVQSSSSNQ